LAFFDLTKAFISLAGSSHSVSSKYDDADYRIS